MGCALYQPQSRSELCLDLTLYLFRIKKKEGADLAKGVMGPSNPSSLNLAVGFDLIWLAWWHPADILKDPRHI